MSILCIGSAADRTFLHTLRAMKRAGLAFDALDLGQLVFSGGIEISLGDLAGAAFTLHGRRHVLGTYRSVFVRTMGLADTAPTDALRHHAAGQSQALIHLLSASPIPVVNPPLADHSNASKVFQAVALAPIAGWRIPRSCQTRSPEEARAFLATCQATGAIFKGGSGAKTWARLFTADDEARLAALPECPVLFQERIDGPDVRVHVVVDRCFAERIDSPETDYRRSRGNRYERIELPPEIAKGCAALTRACGLPFLGIDFKIQRTTGDWYFLEANPQPGYDFYDGRFNWDISRAVLEYLAGAPPPPEWAGAPALPSPDDSTPLRTALGVTVQVLDGEEVIVDEESERGFALNATAREVWGMCDGRHTTLSAAQALAERYDREVTEILPDVRALVHELRDAGFLAAGAEEGESHVPTGDDADEHVRAARRFLAVTAR